MATLARMTPVLLAFDTSTEALAVALQWPGGQLAWNGEGGAQASAALLPTVQRLLDEAGIALAGLDAIAFGCGPGAFTGLRTACSVAQGLAFGADKPVLPIDSLLIVAEDARFRQGLPAALDVAVAMDARMGEVYAARYRWAEGAWHTMQAPGLWEPRAWLASAGAATCGLDREAGGLVWAGNGLPLLEPLAQPLNALSNALSQGPASSSPSPLTERAAPGDGAPAVTVTADRACEDRAAALLRLADQAWREGRAVAAQKALPVYLRDKVALTTAERLALKAAS